MRPTNGDVYVDAALTDFSLGYQNAELIFPKVFPKVTVAQDTGYYFEFGKQAFRRHSTAWSGKTRANQMEWTITKTGSYTLAYHALEMQISWDERENADSAVDYDMTSTQMVLDAMDLDEEISTAEALTTTSNFASYVAKPPTGDWSDPASRPDIDVKNWKEIVRGQVGRAPNKMIVGAAVHANLSIHPALLKYLRVTDGVLTVQQLSLIFGIDYIVGGAVYLSSSEGSTDVFADVWGNAVVLVYTPPVAALRQLSFGYSIEKKNHPIVERWSEQAIHSDWVRPIRKYQKKVVCTYAGYLCQDALTA